jgi:hypothetical protein
MFEVTSITSPSVRAPPDDRGGVVHRHAVLHAEDEAIRFYVRGPLIDECDVETRPSHIRAYGGAIRPRANNRNPRASHI